MKRNILLLFLFLLIMGSGIAQEEKAKPALIVIDVQNAFIDMMDQSDIEIPVMYINAYVSAFTEMEFPVVFVHHTSENNGLLPGTDGYEFIDKISKPESAFTVNKTYGNSFTKTNLDELLKELNCNTIFLCGLSASGCVFATYVGGNDHDYNTLVLKNALMSPDKEVTDMIEDITEAIGPNAMELVLGAIQK